MRTTEKQQKMVFKNHYGLLPVKLRTALRDEFLIESGLPFPSFYHKMNTNSFRPLEAILMEKLLKKYQNLVSKDNIAQDELNKL